MIFDIKGSSKHRINSPKYVGETKDWENAPSRSPMSPMGRLDRSEHLLNYGAVYRVLQSQVGQPWDAVYAKLSKTFSAQTSTGFAIRKAIKEYVRLNASIEGHFLVDSRGRPTDLRAMCIRWAFYITKQGILRNAKQDYLRAVAKKG